METSNRKPQLKVVMLGSERLVGKDTLFGLLSEVDSKFVRYAFADTIKEYCNNLSLEIMGKRVWQLSPEEKEVFRPILLEVGRLGRKMNKDFWAEKTLGAIKQELSDEEGHIAVITDLRFKNEYNVACDILGEESVCVINISRLGAPEPTEDEKLNAPAIKDIANFNVLWETTNDKEELMPHAKKVYEKLKENYDF